MDGSESEMSKRVRKFTAKLEQVTNTSTKLVDERLSSKEAETLAENRGLKNYRKKIHETSACLIAQTWLNEN